MPSAGELFVVATPIGNLGDITLRALEILKHVDAILCEDTRVTAKLLARYEIRKPLLVCHEHTEAVKLDSLVARLLTGESFALVTDAGTPGLSDPGNALVARAAAAGVTVVPIPGASALAALVSVAGKDLREFSFLGFPPHKKGRETYFKRVAAADIPVIYYDSPHRVLKNLELLAALTLQKRVVIGRELTKLHEEIFRGTLTEAKEWLETKGSRIKGEFVILVTAAKE